MIPVVRLQCFATARVGLLQNTGVQNAVVPARFKYNYFTPPDKYPDFEMPEKNRLKMVSKVPMYPPTIRPPRMMKNLRFMRGPEEVHNQLIHKQYGIMALSGGRLKYGHFEMIRRTVTHGMDRNKMFAVWRVDEPWQPVTSKGQGKRLGGGKGYIDHYVTPVKHGRIIMEVGGECLLEEVKPFLNIVVNSLPFKAMIVDHKTLIATKKMEELAEERNRNPFTYKYVVMNQMMGSKYWLKPLDMKYFGKYV